MYKLLLVDDEDLTCETIKNFIPWQVHQIKQVETASNGEEALNLYHELKPDIVVCDIIMPKMNGIELVTRLREIDKDCRIIFISGFADKEYLKSAIDLKVTCFIEKPLMPNDVLDAVKLAISEIEDRERQLNASYVDNKDIIKLNAVTRLISQADDYNQYIQSLQKVNCNPFFTGEVMVVIANLSFDSIIPLQQRRDIQNQIIENFNNNLNKINRLASLNTDNKIVILTPTRCDKINTSMKVARQLYDEIQSISTVKISINIACGNIAKRPSKIKTSYELAMTASNNQFYRKHENICFDHTHGFTYEPGISIYRKYRDVLGSNNINCINEFYEDLIKKVLEFKDQNINSVKNAFFNLMIVLLDYAIRNGNDKVFEQSNKPYIWLSIQEAVNIYDLFDFIKSLTETYLSDELKKGSATKIQTIKEFIKENHANNTLTMDSIAHHLNYSTNYISNLFKKETGLTLIEYTTHVRIEKAKELILMTDLKLYDVASKSGFYDANYFSTVFKRVVGISPSKYKDMELDV